MNHNSNGPGAVAGLLGGSCRLTEELLEWARQQFTEEDYLNGLRDIRETGGVEFRNLIDELERSSASNRTQFNEERTEEMRPTESGTAAECR